MPGHNVLRKASNSHNPATGKMQAAIRNFLVKITEFIFASAPISFPQKLNRIMDLLHIFEITVCETMDDPEL